MGRKRASNWLKKNTRATSRPKGSAGANDDEWRHPDLDYKVVVGRSKRDVHNRFRQFIRDVIAAEAVPVASQVQPRNATERRSLTSEFPALRNQTLLQEQAYHIMEFLHFMDETAKHMGEETDDGWSGLEIAGYMYEKEEALGTLTRAELVITEAALEILLATMPDEVHAVGGGTPLEALWVLSEQVRENPGPRKNPFTRWSTKWGEDDNKTAGVVGYQVDMAYNGVVVWVKPQTFLNLAKRLPAKLAREKTFAFLDKSAVPWGPPILYLTGYEPRRTGDYRQRAEQEQEFRRDLWLPPKPPRYEEVLNTEHEAIQGPWGVRGHEGRHRTTYMKNKGVALVPVSIFFRGGTPSLRARHMPDEFLELLFSKLLRAEDGRRWEYLEPHAVWREGKMARVDGNGKLQKWTPVKLEEALQLGL